MLNDPSFIVKEMTFNGSMSSSRKLSWLVRLLVAQWTVVNISLLAYVRAYESMYPYGDVVYVSLYALEMQQ